MKKLVTLIIVAGLALTIQAQDVTNTLGTDGNFYVNKLGGTPSFLTLSSTGDHSIQLSSTTKAFTIKNSDGEPIFEIDDFANYLNLSMIKLGHADVNFLSGNFAHLQLQASSEDGFSGGNKINFVGINIQNDLDGYFAKGTIATPATVADNDYLLNLRGYGHDGTTYRTATFIQFKVDGTPASQKTPGKIVFGTGSTAEAPAIRMTIKGDGKIGIGTETPTSTLDVHGSMELPVALKSANYTITDTDYTILVGGNGHTMTLPTPVIGRIYVIKNGTTATGTIIDAGSGKAIDGHQTHTLTLAHGYVMIQAVGAHQWIIISEN